MGYIEGIDRNQVILFPEVIDDYIEEDNPVQFINAFVDNLDLMGLGFKYSEPKATGRPPYNPADMLRLYIYGYLNRIRSSRGLEREANRNIELMWLLRKLTPDFKTIADFRKDNRDAIKKVCKEFTLLCKKLDLFSRELVAIDSSKFKAVNSKKRNFNEAKLKRAIKEIEEKVEHYLTELEGNDKEEAKIAHCSAEEIKDKIKILKDRKDRYQGLLKELRESGETQISLTDTDSRAMVNNQRIEVCYNVQTTVDARHKIIVDHETTNDVLDNNQLSKMAKRAKDVMEVEELEVLADKGYYDAVEIKECVDNGISPYIAEPESPIPKAKADIYRKENFTYDADKDIYECPNGSKLTFRNISIINGKAMKIYKTEDCKRCNRKTECTKNKIGRVIYRWEHEDILEDMKKRIQMNKGKYKMRQWLSEHPFGTIKRSMNQGYLLLKGLKKVAAEISLTVLAYNIKRVLNIVGLKRLIEAVG